MFHVMVKLDGPYGYAGVTKVQSRFSSQVSLLVWVRFLAGLVLLAMVPKVTLVRVICGGCVVPGDEDAPFRPSWLKTPYPQV